jgi:hypothetical protein
MMRLALCVLALVLLAGVAPAMAQSTQFTFQGKLSDAGVAANASYDLQFKLFDSPTVGQGAQQGVTDLHGSVVAAGGVFTVTLDLGANVFNGSALFLEIGVRPAGSADPYPCCRHQPVTSAPYAIQALNAQYLGGIAAGLRHQRQHRERLRQERHRAAVGAASTSRARGGSAPRSALARRPWRERARVPAACASQRRRRRVVVRSPNGDPTDEPVATGRADLRFDGNVHRLLAGPAVGRRPRPRASA